MNTLLAAGIIALTSQGAGADPTAAKPIALNFSQTDVSQIFRAIGMRTGTNIIYANADKLPVTLHFNAGSADEAIRGTSAAAGLVYRRVGKFYVVAKPGALRQALVPFSERQRIKTSNPTETAKIVGDLLPDATVTAGEGEIIVVAVPYDIKVAEQLVAERPVASKEPRKVEAVVLGTVPAMKMAPILADLFPSIRVSVLTDLDTGGSVALLGRPEDVAEARAKALELDAASASEAADTVVDTYDVRYASPRTIFEFLRQASPKVTVTIAPPAYSLPGLTSGGAQALGSGGAGTSSGPASTGGNDLGGGTGGGNQTTGNDPGTQGGGVGGGNGANGNSNANGITSAPPPNGGGPQYDRATRLVLRGRKADVDAAKVLLEKVDIRPKQVVVDVRIVDASPEAIDRVGLKYTWQSLRFVDAPAGTYITNPDLEGYLKNTLQRGIGSFSRTPFGFLATLDLMVQKTDSKLLANPSIQVLDSDEAKFFIGDQLSYPITTSGSLGTQNTTIEKYNVGISLNVRPKVNADGDITLLLNPVVQSLTGITNGLPQTNSREARTTVIVKDGETIVLAGLIRDEDIRTVSEVPILSKLPIVGQLFRHSDRSHRKSNIIVTITPHLVPPPEVPK